MGRFNEFDHIHSPYTVRERVHWYCDRCGEGYNEWVDECECDGEDE